MVVSDEEAEQQQQSISGSKLPLPLPQNPLHHRRAVYSYPTLKKPHSKGKGKDKEKDKEKDGGGGGKGTSLLADARAEHLLLAAQRLGRERAFVLGGLMQIEREKEKVRERERDNRRKAAAKEEKEKEKEKEKQRAPKTPKRHGVKMGHKDSLGHPGPTVTPLGIAGGPGRGLFPVPTQGSFHLLNTPISSSYSTFPLSPTRPTHKGRGKGKAGDGTSTPMPTATSPHDMGTRTNPPTPLDSLLSAARSMMGPVSLSPSPSNDGEEEDEDYSDEEGTPGPSAKRKKTTTTTRGRRAMPESPVPPKRRKVGGGAGAEATQAQSQSQSRTLRERVGAGAGGVGEKRVRSALDVLADQAAAAATPPGKGSNTNSNNKGKGRERERDSGEGSSSSMSMSAPGLRPPLSPKTPLAENGTWSTLKPVQWGEEDTSSSPIAEEKRPGEGEGESGDVIPATSMGISLQAQVELERMVLDTLAGAEAQTRTQTHTQTQDGELPLSSSTSPLDSTQSSSQVEPPLPPPLTPDVFGLPNEPTLAPLMTLTSLSEGPPNTDSQSNEGSSNPHQRSASMIPINFFPEPEHDELGNPFHHHTTLSSSNTAPELSMIGLTSMPDFDLGADGMFNGEDAEMEQAMNKDLGRVGSGHDLASSPDTPARRTRSPYVKWSKEEDDLLAQV